MGWQASSSFCTVSRSRRSRLNDAWAQTRLQENKFPESSFKRVVFLCPLSLSLCLAVLSLCSRFHTDVVTWWSFSLPGQHVVEQVGGGAGAALLPGSRDPQLDHWKHRGLDRRRAPASRSKRSPGRQVQGGVSSAVSGCSASPDLWVTRCHQRACLVPKRRRRGSTPGLFPFTKKGN